jgi:arginyl-tRNA synthetase
VAGRNETLRQQLESCEVPPRHRAKVLGFTDQIDELMQVADVVVGFRELEHKSKQDIEQLARGERRFDYLCWDLYARVSQWYQGDQANLQKRAEALHAIEQGGNESADIAEIISSAVLRRHLETMERLSIEYDFLPRESEILHLHFWEAAFAKLKQAGVLTFETEGKNKGCWIMRKEMTNDRDCPRFFPDISV